MRFAIAAVCSTALCLAEAPKTRIAAVTENLHGVSITDPYRWLEDQNSPETRSWIKTQMAYGGGAWETSATGSYPAAIKRLNEGGYDGPAACPRRAVFH